MANFVRWYDRDKHLSTFLGLLEGLSRGVQSDVAMDIMLNLPVIADENLNDFVNNMSLAGTGQYRRWYDYSPQIHSAVEVMKQLNESQRDIIIASSADIILRSRYDDE